jgi:iron(III) transport system ATP-binding protein
VLTVSHLAKSFPGLRESDVAVAAVDDISFEVPERTLFTILGPSGCGKTTALRCIAGLERPHTGEIAVAGQVLFSAERRVCVPANERGLGMVFQSYAIWPHMNVFDNVAFPLAVAPRRSRPPKREIRERVERALGLVRLDGLADRPATDLSGGQQQRLALARALVNEPPLLLLDEPLSNLDAKLREEMRLELKRLQHELGITTVFVTHDQAEALVLSDSIAVMREGRMEQVGTPREIYERPASRFVADFVGAANLIEGSIEGRDPDGLYAVLAAGGRLRAPSVEELAPGTGVTVVVRPEHVRIALDGQPGANGWHGVVAAQAFLGDTVEHVIRVGGLELRARGNPALALPTGAEVTLGFADASCLLIPVAPGERGEDVGGS